MGRSAMIRQMITSCVLLVLLSSSGLLAVPPASKISKDLQSARPNDIVDIVIQYSVVPAAKHKKRRTIAAAPAEAAAAAE